MSGAYRTASSRGRKKRGDSEAETMPAKAPCASFRGRPTATRAWPGVSGRTVRVSWSGAPARAIWVKKGVLPQSLPIHAGLLDARITPRASRMFRASTPGSGVASSCRSWLGESESLLAAVPSRRWRKTVSRISNFLLRTVSTTVV